VNLPAVADVLAAIFAVAPEPGPEPGPVCYGPCDRAEPEAEP
jgi:hypothetical protein